MDHQELDRQRELNRLLLIEHSLKIKLRDTVERLYYCNNISVQNKNKISKIILLKVLNYRKKILIYKLNNNIY